VVPGLIGPAIAAVVAAAVGWRWVFLGLLPLVIAAGVLVVLALRHVPPSVSQAATPVPYLGVLGVVAGAGTALASLSSGVVPVVAIGAVAGGAVLAVSLRRLMPPRNLSARPGLSATFLSRGLLTCCFFAGDAYVPYAIVTVRHAPTTLAALALTASTLTWTAGSWVQARCIARYGPRRLVRPGETLVAVGLGVMCLVLLLPPVPPALAILAWAIAGTGIGTAYSPLSVTTLDRAAAGEEGRATSALQLCDVLGQALGTGVAGAIVAAGAVLGHGHGVALAFFFAIAVALAAVVVSGWLPGKLGGSTAEHPQ
jgi:MFS family permease